MEFEPELPAFLPSESGFFFVSGSGFSNYFPRPSYQNGVVDEYLNALPEGLFSGLYNQGENLHSSPFVREVANPCTEGRGYPDISAQGNNFAFAFNQSLVDQDGVPFTISGTSASAPLVSSIISLINDALIGSGKSPLGFLNPWLYSKGFEGCTDIVGGQADSCGTAGFPVTKGWDPSTGFGTPVFPELLKLASA
jgi:tripeptidyl-peptidase-1